MAGLLLTIAGILIMRLPVARLDRPAAPALVMAGVMAGVATSVWLAPAWVGFLIVVASVAVGYRRTLEKSLPHRAETATGELSA
jgi:hypothetical protein